MTLHDRRPIDAEFLKLQMDTISLCDCPECKQPGYKLFTPVVVNGQSIEFAMTCTVCNGITVVTCDSEMTDSPDGEKITGGN